MGAEDAGADIPPLPLDRLDDQLSLYLEQCEQAAREAQAWQKVGRR